MACHLVNDSDNAPALARVTLAWAVRQGTAESEDRREEERAVEEVQEKERERESHLPPPLLPALTALDLAKNFLRRGLFYDLLSVRLSAI